MPQRWGGVVLRSFEPAKWTPLQMGSTREESQQSPRALPRVRSSRSDPFVKFFARTKVFPQLFAPFSSFLVVGAAAAASWIFRGRDVDSLNYYILRKPGNLVMHLHTKHSQPSTLTAWGAAPPFRFPPSADFSSFLNSFSSPAAWKMAAAASPTTSRPGGGGGGGAPRPSTCRRSGPSASRG